MEEIIKTHGFIWRKADRIKIKTEKLVAPFITATPFV